MKKDRTENIQKTYKKCAPYGNCTEIVQKIYKKCAKFCNSSLVETGSLFELLQILAHFLYIFCTISVQFPYGAHFLYIFCMFSYVFCMFSVRSFFIGVYLFIIIINLGICKEKYLKNSKKIFNDAQKSGRKCISLLYLPPILMGMGESQLPSH